MVWLPRSSLSIVWKISVGTRSGRGNESQASGLVASSTTTLIFRTMLNASTSRSWQYGQDEPDRLVASGLGKNRIQRVRRPPVEARGRGGEDAISAAFDDIASNRHTPADASLARFTLSRTRAGRTIHRSTTEKKSYRVQIRVGRTRQQRGFIG